MNKKVITLNQNLTSTNKKFQYHVVGVAGVGMSAVAQALVAAGFKVTGSDRFLDTGNDLEIFTKLRKAGIEIVPQDGSAISSATTAIVVSTAIEKDNPDYKTATELGVKILHRSEALAMLLKDKPCIAISGTSGKSTVTGMIGWILDALGVDPAVVNGAPVLNWKDTGHVGNVRLGDGLWVVEADESDKSLLNIHPDWAVITNVSKDHFEVDESIALFEKFAAQASKGVLSLIDNPALMDDFVPEVTAVGSNFFYKNVEFEVNVPGKHNAENAFCAVMLCELLGHSLNDISDALKTFAGIERRLEKVGVANGVAVIDDYAHNPAKIKAAWLALSPYCNRMIAVWRPHGYGPLRLLMDEMVEMFAEVMRPSDKLYVLPVYDAGGTTDRSINSDLLVDKLQAKGSATEFVVDTDIATNLVVNGAESGDTVLILGARDPQLPVMAREICKQIKCQN